MNSYGKSTSVVKTILFAEIVPPTLEVNDVPSSSIESTITITGTVTDKLDPSVKVYVNDQLVSSTSGNWTATISLNEGINTIIIVTTNKFGKNTTVVKNVSFFN